MTANEFNAVLLIEDDPDLRNTLQLFLERKGLQVATASGGDEGLDRLRTNRFDLVILDIVMAKGEGMETVSRIKQGDHAPLVIGISGFPDYLPLLQRLGADATLAKPFAMDQLWSTIEDLGRGKAVPSCDARHA